MLLLAEFFLPILVKGCLIEVSDWMIQKVFSFLVGLNFLPFLLLDCESSEL